MDEHTENSSGKKTTVLPLAVSLEAITRPTKDILKSAGSLSANECRFLVDAYYQMQQYRIESSGQMRALTQKTDEGGLPATLSWLNAQVETMERQVARALEQYVLAHEMGPWLMNVYGIGPVISAGLLAHIDIKKAPTVGHIWRFAGLDPTMKWGKGEKRPWNAQLKTLCWKIGESFVKFGGRAECVYGALYKERKLYEQAKNEAGEYGAQAAEVIKARPTHAQKATYAAGKLPDGHVHARAKRYAVKQFLSDFHGEWYRVYFGREAPLPYPIAILGHAHLRKPS
jgi:hypothetical protein